TPSRKQPVVRAVSRGDLCAEGVGPADALLVQPLERGAVGLAVADVHVLVHGLAVPLERRLLALHGDVERLPLAWGLREVFAGDGAFVEGAAVVEGELRHAEA